MAPLQGGEGGGLRPGDQQAAKRAYSSYRTSKWQPGPLDDASLTRKLGRAQ